jgi:outer membrane immunogenic protein
MRTIEMRHMRKTICTTLLAVALGMTISASAHAQAAAKEPTAKTADFALMFVAEQTKYTFGSNIWLQGGAAEAALPLSHHISVVFNLTGDHSSGQNGGQQLSEIALTGGPRYAYGVGHHSRLFVEALFGGVHGFGETFPTPSGPTNSVNAFAMQLGGGYDIDLGSHFAIRAIDAHYVQTRLPNGGNNTQNDLRLGAGIVWRLPVD